MQLPGTNCIVRGTESNGVDGVGGASRRWLEAAGWVLVVSVLWGADLLAKLAERDLSGMGKDDFRLISEQVTSAVAVLIMIPLVLRWMRLFPMKRDAWAAAIIGHTAGSIFFAFGHHALMVAMRIPWYRLNGIDYVWREPFANNLIVEYQKDIKVYLGILLVASAYKLYRRPLRPKEPPAIDRLVVQTGSGRSVLGFDQIDYLEGARNYVSVYADGREYVVRDTMTGLMKKLPRGQFARTHRSFIVNLSRIEEIRNVDGSPRVFLESGAHIPLSRGYREAFESAIIGAGVAAEADSSGRG